MVTIVVGVVTTNALQYIVASSVYRYNVSPRRIIVATIQLSFVSTTPLAHFPRALKLPGP